MSTSAPSLLKRMTDIMSSISQGINTATEIASYCEYSVSTVHRLLQNLADLEWIIQDERTHKYFIGPLITRLHSNPAAVHRYLVVHALKEMGVLSDLTGETINLGILEDLHFIKLHDIPSIYNLRIIEESDRIKGQYIGATAKVLLSQLGDQELKNVLKHIKHGNAAPDYAADSDMFLAEIMDVRKKGYSVSFGERIPGSGCISAPVNHYFCPVALYIVGPEERLKPHLDLYIKELKAGAARISEEITEAYSGQGGTET